jgi:O-succinylbenzoic acid--CoA ligase
VLVGGAALEPRLAARAHDVGVRVVTTYGMSETAGGCVYDGVPFPGVEVRIDEAGQILLRGPVVLRAYRDGTDPRTADGWLPTGDAGHLDADGRLVVDGRVSDLIITGGENVWPATVERSLRGHAAVLEVAVTGRPDAEWGERVVAFVVPTDASRPPSLDALRDHVKAELPPWCAPRELVIVDDLPRTRSGKVQAPRPRR